jgi:hypothetical protein
MRPHHALILLTLLTLALIWLNGCQKKATASDVHQQTAIVTTKLADAHTHLQSMLGALGPYVAAPGQLATPLPPPPPAVVAQVKADATAADKDVTDAAGITPKIDAAADKIETRATKAEDGLAKERDHFVGYKGRVLLWSLAGAFVLAVVLYLIVTDGNGAFLFAIIRGVFRGVKWLAAHLLSGGILAFHNLKTGWLNRRGSQPPAPKV